MSPDTIRTLAMKAKTLLDQGHKESALQKLILAKDLPAGTPDEHYFMGLLFGLAGVDSESIAQFKIALSLDDSHAEAHAMIGTAYSSISKNDLAIPHLERARELHSHYPDLDVTLASTLMHADRYDDAQLVLDSVPASQRDAPMYWSQLIRLRSVQGRYADVIALAKTGFSGPISSIDVYIFLADAYFELGDASKGREHLEDAIRLNPSSAWQISNCALLAYLLGEESTGSELVVRLREQYPGEVEQLRLRLSGRGFDV